MSKLTNKIYKYAQRDLLRKKILITGSHATGRSTILHTVDSEGPLVNLSSKTTSQLCEDFFRMCCIPISEEIVSFPQSLMLMDEILTEFSGNGYFSSLKEQSGLQKAVLSTLLDLRWAGIKPGDLEPEDFEIREKGLDIILIFKNYMDRLQANNLIDTPRYFEIAMEVLHENNSIYGRDVLYLIPEDINLKPLERQFLHVLTGKNLETITVDDFQDWKSGPDATEIFSAQGYENEIREIFRKILHNNLPYDDVEIICCDPTSYFPLLWELLQQFEIPATFSRGIPVSLFRPTKALSIYLKWITDGFQAKDLIHLINAKYLNFKTFNKGNEKIPSFMTIVRCLRELKIGWGKDRYLKRIELLETTIENNISECTSVEKDQSRLVYLEKKRTNVHFLHKIITKLFTTLPDISPEHTVSVSELARSSCRFLKTVVSCRNGNEQICLKRLSETLLRISECETKQIDLDKAVNVLMDLILQDSILASSFPEPGRVHISDFSSGGYSGKRNTYFLGLDASRFPGAGLQDPILLDSERTRINGRTNLSLLALRSEEPQRRIDDARRCIARSHGNSTFSFTCIDISSGQEQAPSSLLLDVFKKTTGSNSSDYRSLMEFVGSPVGFIPGNSLFIEDQEWWMTNLKNAENSQDTIITFLASYPWIEQGMVAFKARQGSLFSIYDGRIDVLPEKLDPRENFRPISCSRIELLAKCPFQYFVREILALEPTDEMIPDPKEWLNPMEFGSLLHAVFQQFMEEITSRGEKCSFTVHENLILSIAKEMIESQKDEIPWPNDAAVDIDTRKILDACRIFLKAEEEHCKNVKPMYFETSFGMKDRGKSSVEGSKDPVWIRIDGTSGFYSRGVIDRVDRRSDGDYEVWDYKTGSTFSMKKGNGLNRGRLVQYAIYALAVEELLKRAGQNGRVKYSGYFFPGPKGNGKRYIRDLNNEQLSQVLTNLFDLLKSGAFPCSTDEEDCRFCEYAYLCGKDSDGVEEKLNNNGLENRILESWRRLLGNG